MSEDNGANELHAYDPPMKSASYDPIGGPLERAAVQQGEESPPSSGEGSVTVEPEASSLLSKLAASSNADAPLLLPEHASTAGSTSKEPEPVASALQPEDLEDADDERTTAASAAKNPFLVPLKSASEGGPPSLLPPAPVLKSPSTPPPVPPALRRTLPPTARPLPPPPASPSTSPPIALSGTIPPYPRMSLDGEIADAQRRARRKKAAMFAMLIAMLVGGYYARGKIGASAAIASKSNFGSVRATGKHEGIKLVLDGYEMGELPQEVRGLSTGQHSIAFEGGDRYQAQKGSFALTPNETKEFELVALRVTKGAATFDVKTPGASLVLVSSDERRILKDYTHPVDIDNAKTWTLEVTKPGFKPLTMPIAFDDRAEKTFVVALAEPDRSVPVAAAAPSETTAEAPAVTKRTQSAAKSEAAAAARTESPAPDSPHTSGEAAPSKGAQESAASSKGAQESAAGKCTLNINSIPASNVTVDGRPLGATPKLGILVAAGTHTVLLVNDTARKATSTTCSAGEEKMIAVRLNQ